jgi:hypothetical protein
MDKTEHMTSEQFKKQPKRSGRPGKQISRAETNYEVLYIKSRVSKRLRVNLILVTETTLMNRRLRSCIKYLPDYLLAANMLKIKCALDQRNKKAPTMGAAG